MRTTLAAGRIPATAWIFDCSPTHPGCLKHHHEDDARMMGRSLLPVIDTMHPYGPVHTYWDGPVGDFWVILDRDHYITIAVDPETGDAAWAVYDWGTDDCWDRGKGRVQDSSPQAIAFLAGRAIGEALS